MKNIINHFKTVILNDMSKTFRDYPKKGKIRSAKENKTQKAKINKKLMNDYYQFQYGEEEFKLDSQ